MKFACAKLVHMLEACGVAKRYRFWYSCTAGENALRVESIVDLLLASLGGRQVRRSRLAGKLARLLQLREFSLARLQLGLQHGEL